MATPIGANTLTSISRRFIIDQIADNVYNSNPLIFRMLRSNRKLVQGGTQIEMPLIWSQMQGGGWYSGYDILDVTPSDTVINLAFDWKQLQVPVTVDGLTLLRSDSPDAIANYLSLQFKQAEMQVLEYLGQGIYSDGVTNPKAITGIENAIGTSATRSTYGGVSTTSYPMLNSQVDSTTTAITYNAMSNLFGAATFGGRHPTVAVTTQYQYNKIEQLFQAQQRFPVQEGGKDEVLASAGFTNIMFKNVPIIVDSHVPTGHLYFLNEDYINLFVSPKADMKMEDFQTPVNQDAMTAKILWAGNLGINNVQAQAKFTALV